MKFSAKKVFSRLLLTSCSILFAIGAFELGLRLFYPKFQYAAESDYLDEDQRIWSRRPNSIYRRFHPDNGEYHYVYHNNLALRQHRDFSEKDLKASINIGFFGDSFTENLRLPGPFSFSEPLDYMLNETGRNFNTLNFGVDGYGTDQSFLTYDNFVYKNELDYVFYIFTANDLRNIYENGIFYLDEQDNLERARIYKPSFPIRVLSKFHLTYLVIESIENVFFNTSDYNKLVDLEAFLDHSKTYHNEIADGIERNLLKNDKLSLEFKQSINIFNTILRKWKSEVESNDGEFIIVLLPRATESIAAKLIDLNEADIIDLFDLFNTTIENYEYKDFFFLKDGHWNEAANYITAKLFYGELTRRHGLEPLTAKAIDKKLRAYYSAFPYSWAPNDGTEPVELKAAALKKIREKYNAIPQDRNQ